MCLLTNQEKPFILKKDMKVYKLLVVLPTEAHPPYFDEFSYKYKKITKTDIYKLRRIYTSHLIYEVRNGFHSFSAKASAKKILRDYDFMNSFYHYGKWPEIVECIIPKGSEIYRGVWGDDLSTKQIVSNQIIVPKPKK